MEQSEFVDIEIKRGIYEIQDLLILMEGRGFICGGYARYCVTSARPDTIVYPGDLDIYCHSEEDYDWLYAKLISLGFGLVDWRKQSKFAASFWSGYNDNAKITVGEVTRDFRYGGPNIQLIKPIIEGRVVTVGTPEEILRNFDFTIARAAIINKNKAIADIDFEKDDQEKFLRIKNIHCPISSSLRFHKYASKGYTSASFEVYKLFLDWDARGQEWKDQVAKEVAEIQELFVRYQEAKAAAAGSPNAPRTMTFEGKTLDNLKEEISKHLRAFYEARNID